MQAPLTSMWTSHSVLVGVHQSHSGMACYSLVRCCTFPPAGGTMSRQLPSASLSASGGDDTFLGTRQDVSVPSSPPGHVLVGVCQSYSGMACHSLGKCCTFPPAGGTMSRQLPSAPLSASGGKDAFLCTRQDVRVPPPPPPPGILKMCWFGWTGAVSGRHLRTLVRCGIPRSWCHCVEAASICMFGSCSRQGLSSVHCPSCQRAVSSPPVLGMHQTLFESNFKI